MASYRVRGTYSHRSVRHIGNGGPQVSAIDTHGMTVDFGKYRGELYTRIPVSYLRWMVNNGHSRADVAQAELDRRGISAEDRSVEISGHAIDSASLRVRKIWHQDRGENEGLHAWLLRVCGESLAAGDPGEDGKAYHKGMCLVFERGELHPTLKTVTRLKGKGNQYEPEQKENGDAA